MCGIVGMASSRDITRDTAERLARMEYRGYDSYGLAALDGGTLAVLKDTGSVGRALAAGRFSTLPAAMLALGHTRWATHGGVTAANAHPHLSYDGCVAVVHNGVITNHATLRRALQGSGIAFASATDSEVAAHLIARYLDGGATITEAIAITTRELEGEYALGVVTTTDPGALYGAKRKSPLVVCHDGTTAVLASDQMALTGIATEVLFLEDGDVVALRPGGAEVFTADGDARLTPAHRAYTPLPEQHQAADKGDWPHFMIKEIHETPAAADTALALPAEAFTAVLGPDTTRPVTLVGAGSAFYVAEIGRYLLAELARTRAVALPSDEAEYLALFHPGDPIVAISQSGETFDTLEVCRAAVAAGAVLTSISNVPNSTQERMAAHRLQQGSGPEICVLSTKSIVSQVTLLARLALETGHARGTLDDGTYQAHAASLARLPQTLRDFLADATPAIQTLAKKYSHVEDWFTIGRGVLYPTALEGALKLKEVSYRHVEGAAAGFFKHGTISLIDTDFHTIALLPSRTAAPDRYAATLAAVSEIAARGGPVIGIGPDDHGPDDLADFRDYLPLPHQGDNIADVILHLVAGQLIAYYCALDLGREIDQPRALAKSVTVR